MFLTEHLSAHRLCTHSSDWTSRVVVVLWIGIHKVRVLHVTTYSNIKLGSYWNVFWSCLESTRCSRALCPTVSCRKWLAPRAVFSANPIKIFKLKLLCSLDWLLSGPWDAPVCSERHCLARFWSLSDVGSTGLVLDRWTTSSLIAFYSHFVFLCTWVRVVWLGNWCRAADARIAWGHACPPLTLWTSIGPGAAHAPTRGYLGAYSKLLTVKQ